MAEAESHHFRTSYPGLIRERVRVWGREAQARGLFPALRDAVIAIDKRLREDPLVWGEALNRLHHLGLTVAVGFHDRIQVRFGVDEQRRVVHVTEMRLLPGHPLYPHS